MDGQDGGEMYDDSYGKKEEEQKYLSCLDELFQKKTNSKQPRGGQIPPIPIGARQGNG
jgi:hypothetical protein